MLIIFDLDDTLIDTSGAITPFKFKECLKRLPLQNFDAAYEELLAIYKKIHRSKAALLTFLERHGFEPSLAQGALEELSSPLPRDFSVPTIPYAKEILEYFRPLHILVLATIGFPSFQKEKLEKAGIDSSIFSKIGILEGSRKKPFYETIVREFLLTPHEVWVCGDRMDVDLIPARELGLKTVHMRRGNSTTESWVDHSITSLKELKEIIQ